MRRRLLLLAPLLLALAALGCGRTADLIPDSEDDAPTATPTAAGTPSGDAQPLLPPASLQASGARQEATEESAASDAALARSVVQILVFNEARVPPVVRDGSGVVIDAERGLILTSSHVVDPFEDDGSPRYTTITIATSAVPGGEPRPTHRAVLVALDPGSELAVLRVVELLAEAQAARSSGAAASSDDGADGAAGEEAQGETGGPILGLPAVVAGDSSVLKRGDPLRLFGHPGLDPSGAVTPQSVMVTAASMTGTRGDPVLSDRAWLKTYARMPHGSAGGPVFNDAGELIGIAAQISYNAGTPVAHVRPLDLAAQVIAEARLAGEDSSYVPPLAHPSDVPGTPLASRDDGVAVSEPLFALDAIEEGDERDLFDYTRIFPAQTAELHYEYVAQGVPNGAAVQEFWYLDGIFQDELSSTFNWTLGPFAVISDRLASPNPAGNPDGVWTLEVWINGALRASGQAFLGVDAPQASLGDVQFASTLSSFDIAPAEPPFSGAPRLVAFFDYQGAAVAERLRWIVFHDNELVYRSPNLPWRGGDSGTWWVGVPLADGLTEGNWQFQLWVDDANLATDSFEVTAP